MGLVSVLASSGSAIAHGDPPRAPFPPFQAALHDFGITPSDLDAATMAARQAEATREGDRGVQERTASRQRFRNLSRSAAIEAARSQHSSVLAAPIWTPLQLRAGERVSEYVDDKTARIDLGDGQRALAVATSPLRARNADGRLAPVDLALKQDGSEYEPRNPLVPTRIPTDVDGHLVVGVIDVRLPGSPGPAGSQIVDGKIFYANTQIDTDTIIMPTPTGVETFWQLRSPNSPVQYRLAIALPRDVVLRSSEPSIAGAGVDVVKNDRVVGKISAPSAQDAQGRVVPTSMTVADGEVVVDVGHRGGDYAFPIMLDPRIAFNWSGYATGDPTRTDYAGWGTWASCGPGTAYPGCQWNFTTGAGYAGAGVQTYAYQGWFDTPSWLCKCAEWNFVAPGTSYVYQFDEYSYFLPNNGNDTCRYSGIYSIGAGGWQAGYPANNVCDGIVGWRYYSSCVTPCNANTGTPTNYAVFGTQVNSGDIQYRNFFVNQLTWAAVYVSDRDAPAVTAGTPAVPAAWVDNSSFEALASDSGVGLASFALNSDVTPDASWAGRPIWSNTSCGVDPANHCPQTAQALSVNTAALQSGSNTITGTASDVIGGGGHQTTSTIGTVKVDHTAPIITGVSGPLWDARNGTADHRREGVYQNAIAVHVSASDGVRGGAAAAQRSGVERIELKVNGVTKATVPRDSACSGDSCPLVGDPTLDTTQFTDGEYDITVAATDKLNHTTTTAPFQVTIDRLGDVYHATAYSDNPATVGDYLAEEWAQIYTFNARHQSDGETTTRDSETCSDSASASCGVVRALTAPSEQESTAPPAYAIFEGASVEDTRLEMADILTPAHQALGAPISSGSLTAALAPWQTAPPAHGASYDLYETHDPGQEGTASTQLHRIWLDRTTKLPLRDQVLDQSVIQSETYYTYERRRVTVGSLPPDEFRVSPPADSSQTKKWSYRTGPLPPSGAGAPAEDSVTEDIAGATAFREMFGLSTDPVLISQLVLAPTRDRDHEQWGTPLTPSESQDLAARLDTVDQMGPIDAYMAGAGATDSAGSYIDQLHGGLIYIGFTANTATHMAAVASAYAHPEKLRSFTAQYSELTLYAVADQVTTDIAYLASQGVSVVSVGPSFERNRVQVAVSNATPSTAATLTARYGAAVEQVAGGSTREPSTKDNARIPPVYGGMSILSVDGQSGGCSAAFSAMKRVSGRRRLYTMTAGHCRSAGRGWFHNFTFIGSIEFSRNSGNADVAYIRDRNARFATYEVWGNSQYDLRRIQSYDLYPRRGNPTSVQTHEGEPVCFSGFTRARLRCGKVTNAAVTIDALRSQVKAKLAKGVCQGDSGGAVFSGSRAVGLLTRSEGPGPCNTVMYATQIEHALNNFTPGGLIKYRAPG